MLASSIRTQAYYTKKSFSETRVNVLKLLRDAKTHEQLVVFH